MKVDIWSDIRCPFCYIGKRKFELALEQFEHKDQVEVVWHSFELDPDLETRKDIDVYDYLADLKGMNRDRSLQIHDQVTRSAAEVGLEYNFDKAVVANSFDAHRLIQLAKSRGFGDAAEEALFKAYFTDGIDISDRTTLTRIAAKIGLDKEQAEQMLQTSAFSEDVKADQMLANQIGVRGVPFFLIDGKTAVSGAQPPAVFLDSLKKAWKESAD